MASPTSPGSSTPVSRGLRQANDRRALACTPKITEVVDKIVAGRLALAVRRYLNMSLSVTNKFMSNYILIVDYSNAE
jgi:hypothetical protein